MKEYNIDTYYFTLKKFQNDENDDGRSKIGIRLTFLS